MVYRGHVERGVVVLDDATALADGTPVEVRVGLATTAPYRSQIGAARRARRSSRGHR